MTAQTPETLGRYEILGVLGKGAMGVVYLGRDPLIGRQLALKTFHLGYSAGDQELEQFRTRFLREAQSAGILTHPNIVTIHDVAVDPSGDFFIAMEYVQGTDLKLLMQRQGRFDPRFVVDIVAQIAEGLGYAHSKGVVHRDIKPANIILTAQKQAKITDFGIARVETSNLTMEGQLLGTPNYMAPEQIQGKEVDHRADIFSLGVMLYELLTGQKPFAADNLTAVTHRIVFEPFAPPEQLVSGLPPGITAVLDRALAKDPATRYDRGADMASDLRAIFDPSAAVPPARTGSFLDGDASPPPPAAATPAPPMTPDGTLVASIRGSAVAPSGAVLPGVPPQAAAQPPVPPSVAPAQTPAGPDTSAVAPAPGTGAFGKGFLAVPSAARMALVAASVLAISLVVAGAARLAVRDEVALPGEDPKLQLQLSVLPHLKEGVTLLDAGEPSAALEAFQRALALAPDDRDLRRLRDQARHAALEDFDLEGHLEATRRALRKREYPTAIRLTEQVLAIDPDHGDARELLASAREGQDRQEQARAGPRDTSRSPPPVAAPPRVAAGTTPAPAAQATLAVDFFSEVSEGSLTIFEGQERIFQQPFKFVSGKSGILRRARKTSGSLKGNLTLPAGDVDLRVYVWRKGAQTKSAEIKGNLPAGSVHTLTIQVSAEGRVSLQLE